MGSPKARRNWIEDKNLRTVNLSLGVTKYIVIHCTIFPFIDYSAENQETAAVIGVKGHTVKTEMVKSEAISLDNEGAISAELCSANAETDLDSSEDSEEDLSFKVTIEEIPPKNLLNDLQKNSKSPTRRKNSAMDNIDGEDPKCSSSNRMTPFLLDIASNDEDSKPPEKFTIINTIRVSIVERVDIDDEDNFVIDKSKMAEDSAKSNIIFVRKNQNNYVDSDESEIAIRNVFSLKKGVDKEKNVIRPMKITEKHKRKPNKEYINVVFHF